MFVVLILVTLIGCSNEQVERVTKADDIYKISVPINAEVMNEEFEKIVGEDLKKQFNVEHLDADKTRVELEIVIKEEVAAVRGTVFFKEGSYDFNGFGIAKQFTSPDTEKSYYYADVETDEGFNFLTMFSVEDNRAYVETPVPVKIGEGEYHAMFGEKFVNKQYWDALWEQAEDQEK
jgi:hypothetical protein